MLKKKTVTFFFLNATYKYHPLYKINVSRIDFFWCTYGLCLHIWLFKAVNRRQMKRDRGQRWDIYFSIFDSFTATDLPEFLLMFIFYGAKRRWQQSFWHATILVTASMTSASKLLSKFQHEKNSYISEEWISLIIRQALVKSINNITSFPSHFLSVSSPAWVAQWWACRTHGRVVVSSIPGWGDFSFRRIFASHLCRSIWEK